MTQKRPKAERTQAIVRAAIEEFLEKGYEGASMDAIAARCGISKGGLYHHFENKDAILLYANQFLTEPIVKMMAKAQGFSSAREGLVYYIRRYLLYWKKRRKELIFFFLSLTKILARPDLQAMYEAYAENMFAFFEGLLQKGIDGGEFRAHAARQRGVLLVSALDGIISYLVLDRHLRVDAIASEFERVFLEPFDKT